MHGATWLLDDEHRRAVEEPWAEPQPGFALRGGPGPG